MVRPGILIVNVSWCMTVSLCLTVPLAKVMERRGKRSNIRLSKWRGLKSLVVLSKWRGLKSLVDHQKANHGVHHIENVATATREGENLNSLSLPSLTCQL